MTTRFLCVVAIASLACAAVALAGTPATKADSQPAIVYVAPLHPVNNRRLARDDPRAGHVADRLRLNQASPAVT